MRTHANHSYMCFIHSVSFSRNDYDSLRSLDGVVTANLQLFENLISRECYFYNDSP